MNPELTPPRARREPHETLVHGVRLVDDYHLANEIKWITSFLSADRKKTYCLYEAENADVLRKHAADLGLPADVITQVDEFVR